MSMMSPHMRPAGRAVANAMQAAAAAQPVPLKLGDLLRDDFYQYGVTVTFVGSDNQFVSIPIQSDAHFIIVSTYYNSNAATNDSDYQGAGVDRGGSLVQLIDGGSQRFLSNIQVPANCLFGSAQRPYVWPLRKLIRANTSLGLNVTDTTGASQKVDYVFGGFKVPIGSRPDLGL
jgi:hypothetical protein